MASVFPKQFGIFLKQVIFQILGKERPPAIALTLADRILMALSADPSPIVTDE